MGATWDGPPVELEAEAEAEGVSPSLALSSEEDILKIKSLSLSSSDESYALPIRMWYGMGGRAEGLSLREVDG